MSCHLIEITAYLFRVYRTIGVGARCYYYWCPGCNDCGRLFFSLLPAGLWSCSCCVEAFGCPGGWSDWSGRQNFHLGFSIFFGKLGHRSEPLQYPHALQNRVLQHQPCIAADLPVFCTLLSKQRLNWNLRLMCSRSRGIKDLHCSSYMQAKSVSGLQSRSMQVAHTDASTYTYMHIAFRPAPRRANPPSQVCTRGRWKARGAECMQFSANGKGVQTVHGKC